MRVTGFVALGVAVVAVVEGVALVIGSLPDIARYRRLRGMSRP